MVSQAHLAFIYVMYKLVQFTLPKIWPAPKNNLPVPSLDHSATASSSSSQSLKRSATASYSSSGSLKNDVFLSYRVDDAGRTFVDRLYSALQDQKVSVIKYDETVFRGEPNTSSLIQAIQESRIAIVVFSENYANPSWCLDELEYIMKCKEERGLLVFPVFYGVNPSEVRKQNGRFGERFAEQAAKNPTKSESWREALRDASQIAGWEYNYSMGSGSRLIIQIVEITLAKLLDLNFDYNVNEGLVGMEDRMQDLKSLLDVGSPGVRMVGICGSGGGGKTTLATSLFSEIRSYFDCRFFLGNVREKSRHFGLRILQEELLSGLSKSQVKVESVEEGKDKIKRMLRCSSVLVVLDDVWDLDQLEALTGSHDWFGNESRIIITTRDEGLLKRHRVDKIYHVKPLTHDESIELFKVYAYNKSHPVEDYETFSLQVVSYAGGLPLAIKVLGSFLYDKERLEWISALKRLKVIPPLEITQTLKISYDGLEPIEKELFLDIVCFWRSRSTNDAMDILEACGYYSQRGIQMLIEKSLISIVEDRFTMHDMIQEMGHYIVRGENPNNPETHSRVWKDEEIRNMCSRDTIVENHKIEMLKYNGHDHSSEFFEAVSNMKRLRWLCVTLDDDVDQDAQGPNFLSNELRCIHWERYPKSPFPDSFQATELVILELSKCSQEELWQGCKWLPHLKVLRLEEMKKLLRTPDFNELPRLKKLTLLYCDELEAIHPSLGVQRRLEYVTVSRCRKLKLFPEISQMEGLKVLKIEFCMAIVEFPKIQAKLESLDVLSLQSVGIKILPSSIDELSNLRELNLSRNAFIQIDCSLSNFTRLKFLNLSHCRKLIALPALPSNLATLKADYCNSLDTAKAFNSNCKWLCQVSLMGGSIINNGDVLLQSMLKGNAIENHSMHIQLQGLEVAKGFTPRLHAGSRFTLQLKENWRNNFCGFLMCAVWTSNRYWGSSVQISMKHGVDSQRQRGVIWEESDSSSAFKSTLMWYVSFGSLNKTSWWNQTRKSISFEVEDKHNECSGFGVRLLPKESRNDLGEASTYVSYGTVKYVHHFEIKCDSESALTIGLKSLLTTD